MPVAFGANSRPHADFIVVVGACGATRGAIDFSDNMARSNDLALSHRGAGEMDSKGVVGAALEDYVDSETIEGWTVLNVDNLSGTGVGGVDIPGHRLSGC